METVLEVASGLDAWAVYALLGVLVFGESAAVPAVLLPGEISLLAAGAAAANGWASLPVVVAVGVAAAIAGHAVAYEIGRRHGLRILRWPLLRRYAQRVERAAILLARHGGGAVFFGRWTNVGRIVVPVLVGAARMRYRTFTVFNVLGGIAWAGTFVLLGAAAGSSVGAVEQVAGAVSWWVVAAAGLILGGVAVRRRLRRRRPPVGDNDECESGGLTCGVRLPGSAMSGGSA